MFKIYDGREQFYQWDLDRKLIVDDASITEVHFCNRTDSCSLICETFQEDGLTLVNVPNILLQTDWKIHVYAYDGNYTKHDECFEVIGRTKPADYVYTETEVKNWEDIVKIAEEAKETANRASDDVLALRNQMEGKANANEVLTLEGRVNFHDIAIEKLEEEAQKTYVVNTVADLLKTKAKIGDTSILIDTQLEYWAKLGNNGSEKGIKLYHPENTNSDGYNFYTTIGGRDCVAIPSVETHPINKSNRYIYFTMSDLTKATTEITFKVSYFDRGTDRICIQYNAANGAVAKEELLVRRANTDKWKEATITITDAKFIHNAALSNQDFRIQDKGTDGMFISDVEVITHTKTWNNTNKNIYMLTDKDYTVMSNWIKIG